MYGSQSFNHSTLRSRRERGVPRETFSARQARRRAIERQTDDELRLYVRGTWIELELSIDGDDFDIDGSDWADRDDFDHDID